MSLFCLLYLVGIFCGEVLVVWGDNFLSFMYLMAVSGVDVFQEDGLDILFCKREFCEY